MTSFGDMHHVGITVRDLEESLHGTSGSST